MSDPTRPTTKLADNDGVIRVVLKWLSEADLESEAPAVHIVLDLLDTIDRELEAQPHE